MWPPTLRTFTSFLRVCMCMDCDGTCDACRAVGTCRRGAELGCYHDEAHGYPSGLRVRVGGAVQEQLINCYHMWCACFAGFNGIFNFCILLMCVLTRYFFYVFSLQRSLHIISLAESYTPINRWRSMLQGALLNREALVACPYL